MRYRRGRRKLTKRRGSKRSRRRKGNATRPLRIGYRM